MRSKRMVIRSETLAACNLLLPLLQLEISEFSVCSWCFVYVCVRRPGVDEGGYVGWGRDGNHGGFHGGFPVDENSPWRFAWMGMGRWNFRGYFGNLICCIIVGWINQRVFWSLIDEETLEKTWVASSCVVRWWDFLFGLLKNKL